MTKTVEAYWFQQFLSEKIPVKGLLQPISRCKDEYLQPNLGGHTYKRRLFLCSLFFQYQLQFYHLGIFYFCDNAMGRMYKMLFIQCVQYMILI